MKLRLDTHALLWRAGDGKRLKRSELDAGDLDRELARSSFLELPIAWRHAELAGSLPRHHDDPFDRMLIAQAQAEQLVLVSYDPAFRDYDVALRPTPAAPD